MDGSALDAKICLGKKFVVVIVAVVVVVLVEVKVAGAMKITHARQFSIT
jgi:hypothetical protein